MPKKPVMAIVGDDESIREGTMDIFKVIGFVAMAFPSAARRHSQSASCIRPAAITTKSHRAVVRGGDEAADLPQVACFDTAFHPGYPEPSDRFALPRPLYDESVRRHGFHGLSYEYVSAALRNIAPDIASGRVVIAHLGSGASACALRDGWPHRAS